MYLFVLTEAMCYECIQGVWVCCGEHMQHHEHGAENFKKDMPGALVL